MGQITLVLKSSKSTRQVVSIQQIKDQFLFGIDLLSKDGKPMPDSTYDYWIKSAQDEIEKFLTIKMNPQIIAETKDFHYDDWVSWSQLKATYFITAAISLSGFVGSTKQVDYPQDWLTVRRDSDGQLYSRLLHVLPNNYTTYHQSAALYSGFFPNMGWMGAGRHTPEYWQISYVTGFQKVPDAIKTAVGMLASLMLLIVNNEAMANRLGFLGVTNKSISIDGLSQSNGTYVNGNAGIFGARIKQYSNMLLGERGDKSSGMLKDLQDYFGAVVWGVC